MMLARVLVNHVLYDTSNANGVVRSRLSFKNARIAHAMQLTIRPVSILTARTTNGIQCRSRCLDFITVIQFE